MDTAGSASAALAAFPAPETETGPGFFSPAGLALPGPPFAASSEPVEAGPGSESVEPGSLGLARPAGLGGGEADGQKEVVHATMSRSLRTCATASSSV